MTQLLHPVAGAAIALGIGRSKLYQLTADGEIATVKIGRRTLITHEELERYVRSLQDEHSAAAEFEKANTRNAPIGA